MRPELWTWAGAHTTGLLEMVALNRDADSAVAYEVQIDFQSWACPALTAFMEHALRVLSHYPKKGDLDARLIVIPPSRDKKQWSVPPHNHDDKLMILVHYLSPGDAFAPLVVFENDTESKGHVVTPQVGLTVVFDARQMHGVLNNGGSLPRIALVVASKQSDSPRIN